MSEPASLAITVASGLGHALRVADASPSPSPHEPNADLVSPGVWGFISLVFLLVAVFFIARGLNKQLKRIDFDEDAPVDRGPTNVADDGPASHTDPA
mgnify:CR=1 FL=1